MHAKKPAKKKEKSTSLFKYITNSNDVKKYQHKNTKAPENNKRTNAAHTATEQEQLFKKLHKKSKRLPGLHEGGKLFPAF